MKPTEKNTLGTSKWKISSRSTALAIALVLLCPFFPAFAATDAPFPMQEIKRLVEEAPRLSSYPGKEAVVLSRHLDYRLLADGSMEKRAMWVIVYKGTLPTGWEGWTVPAPEGGSAEIATAALFSIPGLELVRSLDVTENGQGGGKGVSLRVPVTREESLLILETVQRFPKRLDLDDQIQVQLDFPQWEFRAEVEIPAGTKLHWSGSGAGQPEKKAGLGTERYAWTAQNLPAWEDLPILAGGRPVLGFSLKSGMVSSLESARDLEKSLSPLPPGLASLLSGKDPVKSGFKFLEALGEEKSRNIDLPSDWVRLPSSNAFREGPWTDREATLIALNGLKAMGWAATSWWLSSIPVADGMPAGIIQLGLPVAELTPPGGKPFLFVRNKSTKVGKTHSSLIGSTLYRLEDGKLVSYTVPAGSAGGNRLSTRWDLKVSETGMAEGKLSITLRGGWDYLLGRESGSTARKGESVARRMLASTPFLSGMGAPSVSESGGVFQIQVPVRGLIGIASQKDLLVGFPAAGIPGAGDLLEGTGDKGLRFPFSISQEFVVRLPAGFRILEDPVMKAKKEGLVAVEEIFRNRDRKGLVEATQVVSVKSVRLDQKAYEEMKESLFRALRWGANTIPLRKR